MTQPNRRAPKARLSLESLEGRSMPSPMIPAPGPVPAALVRGTSYLFLNGTAHGKFMREPGIPDVGSSFVLYGNGRLTPLGASRVGGTFHGTGFVAHGQSTAQLTLSDARGSVTLSLEGPAQGGFADPTSGTYNFSVVKGTHAFAHTIGTGTVDVTFDATGFHMSFHGDPNRF